MSIDALPNDVDALRALVSQLTSERDVAMAESRRLTDENDQLRHLLRQLQRAQFGQRSERLDRDQMQLALEDIEISLADRDDNDEGQQNNIADRPVDERNKRRINRGALPAHLPRVHVSIEPESTVCPCCKGQMHVIGEDSSQRLDRIPVRYQVIVTHRPKYGCRACESAVVQAPAPERLIKNGIPTERLVASVVVDKYAWHNPLYRQAQIMRLQGLPVDRSTLAFWVGVAAAEVKPVYQRLKEILLGSAKIAVDETRAPVLDPGRGRTKTGYFWAISRDDRPWGGSDPPGVAYTYAPGRGGKHAIALLAGYSGIVQCDGYAVYEQLADPTRPDGQVRLAFCWLHWRREFFDIDKGGAAPIAHEALERIAALYAIESRIRGRSAEERRAVRQAETKPLVEKLKAWLENRLLAELEPLLVGAFFPARDFPLSPFVPFINDQDSLGRFLPRLLWLRGHLSSSLASSPEVSSSVIGRRSVALLRQRLVAAHRVPAVLASVLIPDTKSTAGRVPASQPMPAGDGRRSADRSPGWCRTPDRRHPATAFRRPAQPV
jgi:transposase